MPEWSPTRTFKGYAAWGEPEGAGRHSLHRAAAASCDRGHGCGVHGYDHAGAWGSSLQVSDQRSFWGARLLLLGRLAPAFTHKQGPLRNHRSGLFARSFCSGCLGARRKVSMTKARIAGSRKHQPPVVTKSTAAAAQPMAKQTTAVMIRRSASARRADRRKRHVAGRPNRP